MINFVPEKVFFVSGKGVHQDELISFELALRDAGVEMFNFVSVSSIYPPSCKIVDKEEGIKELKPGQIVFCVMARYSSNKVGEKIFSAVGCAFPKDPSKWGYFTEYHGTIDSLEDDIKKNSMKLSIDFFGVNLSGKLDPGIYAEKSAIYMLETAFGEKVKSSKSIYQDVVVPKDNWASVVSIAVFV